MTVVECSTSRTLVHLKNKLLKPDEKQTFQVILKLVSLDTSPAEYSKASVQNRQ